MLPDLESGLSYSLYFIYIGSVYTFLVYLIYVWSLKQKLDANIALNLAFILMVVGFVGARLTSVFWESYELFKESPEMIYQFWQGGFVFFGGAIPAALACVYYLKRKKEPIAKWLDFYAPIGALGYGLGRIGCSLAGCCYGQFCELPWAVNGRHPTQLYAVIWELITFGILMRLRLRKMKAGMLFAIWIALHSLGRMIMENYREDFRGRLIFDITISMWISLFLFAAAVSYLISKKKNLKLRS